ncbi:MAG: PfkB family carbohydrate kinase, partial [bacterium]|nr:PfkB family carbohydrate kinase [bacterium]
MRKPTVLVVGSANVDFVVRVPRLPVPGETVLGGALERFFGGKGANQAVAAARAGGRVRLICRLGDDEAGAAYRRHLQEEEIAPEGLFRDKTATGAALIAVDSSGRNQIVVAPGANARLTVKSLRGREKLLDAGDAVLAQLEVPLETVRLAFRRARARGAITVLNPAPAAKPLSRALLGQVDVLVPNETEAAALLGRKRAPATERALWRSCGALLGLGPGAVVLTAGARGALFREEAGGGWVRPPQKIRA